MGSAFEIVLVAGVRILLVLSAALVVSAAGLAAPIVGALHELFTRRRLRVLSLYAASCVVPVLPWAAACALLLTSA